MRLILIVAILAAVQGLTEFLPVSSSGHLVILEALLGFRKDSAYSGVVFEVAVHVGTLGAVLIYYRSKVISLIRAMILSLASIIRFAAPDNSKKEDLKYVFYILIGTLPAALIGLIFKSRIEDTFNNASIASIFLILTSIYLLLSKVERKETDLNAYSALLIGCAQALAILPGISRSGWTIVTALLLGINYFEAAQFSFLLSIPAILGAVALEIFDSGIHCSGPDIFVLLFGSIIAFLSGFVALKLLIKILKGMSLYKFSYYLFPAGVAALVYLNYFH